MKNVLIFSFFTFLVGLGLGYYICKNRIPEREKIVYVEKEETKKIKNEVKKEIKKPDGTIITKTITKEKENKTTNKEQKIERKKYNYLLQYNYGINNQDHQIFLQKQFLSDNLYFGVGYGVQNKTFYLGVSFLF